MAERAHAAGRPVACYIREASLGASPRTRRTHLGDTLVRHLSRVATRLTSLGHVAAEREWPGAAEFEAALGDLLDLIRQVE